MHEHFGTSSHDNNNNTQIYLKNLNPNYHPPNADTQIETFLKSFSNNLLTTINNLPTTFKQKPNITSQMRQALYQLKHQSNIVIKPADKNLGPTVIDTQTYLEHIDNYFTANTTPLTTEQADNINNSTQTQIKDILVNNLLNNNSKTQNFLSFLTEYPQTFTPTLYGLPKLHKDKLNFRPILGAHSCHTTRVATFFSKLLLPFCQSLPTYLKSSYDLTHHITKLNDTLPELLNPLFNSQNHKLWLISGDVESLYPNIDTQLLITIVTQHLTEIVMKTHLYLPLKNLMTVLPHLLKLILKNTVLQHPNTNSHKLALQIDGIPMGLNAAVELATLYMHHLFHKLNSPNVIIKNFYIDDIFIIFLGHKHELDTYLLTYNQQHPKIKINWNISEQQTDFLDLHITFNSTESIIETQTHQKLLNKYLYLPPTSYHPKHTQLGFIKGELIRYARLSSNLQKFNNTKQLFQQRLSLRGYPLWHTNPIFQNFNYSDHHTFKPKQQQNIPKFPFILPYNPTTANLNVSQIYRNTTNYEYLPLALKNIVNAWSQPPSLGQMLIKAAIRNNPSPPKLNIETPQRDIQNPEHN